MRLLEIYYDILLKEREMEIAPKWLIDDASHVLKRAWSMRVAAFWSVIGAFVMVAPLLSDEAKALFGPWQFGGVLFIAGVSFGLARALKQPGTDE